jgi:hypothetical protein
LNFKFSGGCCVVCGSIDFVVATRVAEMGGWPVGWVAYLVVCQQYYSLHMYVQSPTKVTDESLGACEDQKYIFNYWTGVQI